MVTGKQLARRELLRSSGSAGVLPLAMRGLLPRYAFPRLIRGVGGADAVGDFVSDASKYGRGQTLRQRARWAKMRMDPTDIAEVGKEGEVTREASPGMLKHMVRHESEN